jgi:hypothetical protein
MQQNHAAGGSWRRTFEETKERDGMGEQEREREVLAGNLSRNSQEIIEVGKSQKKLENGVSVRGRWREEPVETHTSFSDTSVTSAEGSGLILGEGSGLIFGVRAERLRGVET